MSLGVRNHPKRSCGEDARIDQNDPARTTGSRSVSACSLTANYYAFQSAKRMLPAWNDGNS
jgi:hypothetical protein